MQYVRYLERTAEFAVAMLLLVMVILVSANIFLRFFFNGGIVVTEELSRIFLSALIFIGAVVALGQGRHICMPLVIERLPKSIGKVVVLLSGSLVLYCNWLLVKGAYVQMALNMDSRYPVSGVSAATPYAIACIAGMLLTMIMLAKMILVMRGRVSPEKCFASQPDNDAL